MPAKVQNINCHHYRFGVGTCMHPAAPRGFFGGEKPCVMLHEDRRVLSCALQVQWTIPHFERWDRRDSCDGDKPPRPVPESPPRVGHAQQQENVMELKLGQKGRDRITGFEGTITGMCDYLSGCNQALLVPRVTADGAFRQGEWFDVQRVEVTDANAITLDNSQTPGPDREAPKP